MAVPKSRTSKARRDRRRSHDGLATPAMATCPECNGPKAPHRVCPGCGFYKDRAVIETEQE